MRAARWSQHYPEAARFLQAHGLRPVGPLPTRSHGAQPVGFTEMSNPDDGRRKLPALRAFRGPWGCLDLSDWQHYNPIRTDELASSAPHNAASAPGQGAFLTLLGKGTSAGWACTATSDLGG